MARPLYFYTLTSKFPVEAHMECGVQGCTRTWFLEGGGRIGFVKSAALMHIYACWRKYHVKQNHAFHRGDPNCYEMCPECIIKSDDQRVLKFDGPGLPKTRN